MYVVYDMTITAAETPDAKCISGQKVCTHYNGFRLPFDIAIRSKEASNVTQS